MRTPEDARQAPQKGDRLEFDASHQRCAWVALGTADEYGVVPILNHYGEQGSTFLWSVVVSGNEVWIPAPEET